MNIAPPNEILLHDEILSRLDGWYTNDSPKALHYSQLSQTITARASILEMDFEVKIKYSGEDSQVLASYIAVMLREKLDAKVIEDIESELGDIGWDIIYITCSYDKAGRYYTWNVRARYEDKEYKAWRADDSYQEVPKALANQLLGKQLTKKPSSAIEHPSHYNMGQIETIDFMMDMAENGADVCVVTAVKYCARYRHKGKPVEDLKKAKFYLERAIRELEESQTQSTSSSQSE